MVKLALTDQAVIHSSTFQILAFQHLIIGQPNTIISLKEVSNGMRQPYHPQLVAQNPRQIPAAGPERLHSKILAQLVSVMCQAALRTPITSILEHPQPRAGATLLNLPFLWIPWILPHHEATLWVWHHGKVPSIRGAKGCNA